MRVLMDDGLPKSFLIPPKISLRVALHASRTSSPCGASVRVWSDGEEQHMLREAESTYSDS